MPEQAWWRLLVIKLFSFSLLPEFIFTLGFKNAKRAIWQRIWDRDIGQTPSHLYADVSDSCTPASSLFHVIIWKHSVPLFWLGSVHCHLHCCWADSEISPLKVRFTLVSGKHENRDTYSLLPSLPSLPSATLIIPNLSSHPGRNVARLKNWACPVMQLHFVVSCIPGQICVKSEWMLNRNWCSRFRFCRLICSNLQLRNWEITLMNLLPVFLTLIKFILGWQYKQLLKFTLT